MREVYPTITEEGFVVVSLSVEMNIASARLAQYAERNGFDWRFAVMTEDFLAAVVSQYDSRAITPPSTPHFVLSPSGTLGPLRLGGSSGSEILSELRAAG